MENTINQVFTAFRTFYFQISSDRNIKNLSNKNLSDTLPGGSEKDIPVSMEDETSSIIRENTIKYSTTDENKIVVQVIRDESGKVIRTIPLNEQHALDTFE